MPWPYQRSFWPLDSGGASAITQLTGDVAAGPGPGSVVATIQPGVVTLAKMANIATNTVLGRSTAGSGSPEALTSITPASAAFSGTAGLGFVSLLTQSSVPAAPASGFTQFADSVGRFSWRRASDGFTRSFDVTATANRTFTIPDASFTFAGQNLANTFSLAQTFSANGALSAPAVSFTGTPITGGTSTTTKPLVLIETAGATSTGWVTSGTMLGVNAPSGFVGSLIAGHVNGAAPSVFRVTYAGTVYCAYLAMDTSNAELRIGTDTYLIRKAAANWQLGAADAAAPVAQTLSVQSVSAGTSNTAGVNWTLKGSASSGSGAGGNIVWQVTPAGSSGTAQNAFVTGLSLEPSGTGGSVVRIGSGTTTPILFNFSGVTTGTAVAAATSLAFYHSGNGVNEYGFAFIGANRSGTSGAVSEINASRAFVPTSGSGVYNQLQIAPTINQTGGANGITRGIYINPTLTAAADFRALEITDGNVVLPKTITAGGTTGAQTINKVSGSVNFAAAATSLVVTNSYVTTSSIIICTVATNDTTMKSVAVVAAAGSFTIYANAAATAETRVNFLVTN